MSQPLLLIVEGFGRTNDSIKPMLYDYDVLTTTTGQEALNLFEKNHLKLRIVILPLILPDMDGLEVLKQMRKISTLPEIMVVSENKDIKNAVRSMKAGAYEFLVAPINESLLRAAISKALEEFDYLKKIEEFSKRNVLVQLDLDRRLAVSEEIIAKRNLEGKSVSADDVLSLFPHPDVRGDLSVEELRESILKKIDSHFMNIKKATVLVVEDEKLYRNMICDILKEKFIVLEAEDGETALSVIKNNENIDVVLLDMFLPDSLGAELVAPFRKYNPNIEIIVVTAFEVIDKAVKALREGACDYLNKPVLKEDLILAVNNALERKYFKTVLPEFKRQFIEKKLSDATKYSMLNDLCRDRIKEGKIVTMEDVYLFFPDLKNTFVPEGLTLPSHIISGGMSRFVAGLREKLGSFQSTDIDNSTNE